MSLADPQKVSIDGTILSLPRVGVGPGTSRYSDPDGTCVETVSHTYGKRVRRTVRVDFAKIAADPLISAQNIKHSMSIYLVVDVPITGYTAAQAEANLYDFAAHIVGGVLAGDAASGVLANKFTGGES